jgi:hypothetical protein
MTPDRPSPAEAHPQPRIITLSVRPHQEGALVLDMSAAVRRISEQLLGNDEEAREVPPNANRLFHIEGRWEDAPTLVAVSVTVRRDVERIILLSAIGTDGKPLNLSAYRPVQSQVGTQPMRIGETKPERPIRQPDAAPQKPNVNDIALIAFLGQQAREGDPGIRGFVERVLSSKEMGVAEWDKEKDVGEQLHLLNRLAGQGRVLGLLRGLAFLKATDALQMQHQRYAIALIRKLAGRREIEAVGRTYARGAKGGSAPPLYGTRRHGSKGRLRQSAPEPAGAGGPHHGRQHGAGGDASGNSRCDRRPAADRRDRRIGR